MTSISNEKRHEKVERKPYQEHTSTITGDAKEPIDNVAGTGSLKQDSDLLELARSIIGRAGRRRYIRRSSTIL